MPGSKIVLVGGSGAVGQALLALPALPDVQLLLRRPVANIADRHVQHIADPVYWPAMIAQIAPDVLICTLGTTMAQAGSKAAFRVVDHDLVLVVAQAARDAGARHMILVSSVGANAKAGSFYLRTKGEIENTIISMNYDVVNILRPGLLTGVHRPDRRPGEALAILMSPISDALLWGGLARYRSTPVDRLARAILALLSLSQPGVNICENHEITDLTYKAS
jgi:uncharacterized protein YbjT (DUF2867 family)